MHAHHPSLTPSPASSTVIVRESRRCSTAIASGFGARSSLYRVQADDFCEKMVLNHPPNHERYSDRLAHVIPTTAETKNLATAAKDVRVTISRNGVRSLKHKARFSIKLSPSHTTMPNLCVRPISGSNALSKSANGKQRPRSESANVRSEPANGKHGKRRPRSESAKS